LADLVHYFQAFLPTTRRSIRAILALEQLETRLTPATPYTWTDATRNGIWEDNRNWASANPPGYPGWSGAYVTTNDTAIFNNTSGLNATMTASHEIAGLQVQGNYTGTLTLQFKLTINSGGIMAGGTLAQGSSGGDGSIELSGGQFSWSAG